MKHKELLLTFVAWAVAYTTSGCTDQEYIGKDVCELPIALAADYQVSTRVTDAGFADSDQMGIFITDYVNGVPEPIQLSGNRANNVLFTYHEATNKWEGSSTIYWKDSTTPIDVMGYYPFDAKLASVNQYQFQVQKRQDTPATSNAKGGYETSDLLWNKKVNVAPTKETIHLLYHHLMAGVTVRLQQGKGFSDGEWATVVKQAWIDNTVLTASVDLEKGIVSANGKETEQIIPLPYKSDFRAVVVPQTVDAGKCLIGVTVDGVNYQLTKEVSMTYTSGKMHVFTIKVDKRAGSGDYEFSLANEAVTAWIDDPDFHDGLIREYIIVDVDQPGTLEQRLKDLKLNFKIVSSLKVTGVINHKDLLFMGKMPALTYLNLHDVRIDDEDNEQDDVITGFENAPLIRIVLPARLRGIGNQAFQRSKLSGTLIIPEGVEFIGYGAFIDCPFYADIKLPSTIKRIESDAFRYSNLEGELQLPEGLTFIGGGAFGELNLYGQLSLPNTLTELGEGAFASCNFTGDLVIPQGIKMWNRTFVGCDFSHVEIPEGVETISNQMFTGVPLKGELLLPQSLKHLNESSFESTTISSVVLPKGLKSLKKKTFYNCGNLQGVITIPRKILAIEEEVFAGCKMLDGVHLHQDILYIAKGAFARCLNMNTLICDAVTPPIVEPGAFDGVPKDNFSIEVPAEAIAAYKMADGWKDFKRITAYSNFVCRPATACAINTMHEETLILNADGPWSISHKPDWCEVTPSEGNGKTSLRLRINALSKGAANRRDSVVFAMNGTPFTTYCNVEQYDYEFAENQLVALQKHTKGKGINILFLGDGYDAKSLAAGEYMNLVREEMKYFFDLAPFNRFADYFNVYAGITLSQETGINTVNTYKNTLFGTIFAGSKFCNGPAPRLMPEDRRIYSYITQTLNDTPFKEEDLSRLLVVLIPNTSEYGGVTYCYEDGRAIAICPRSEQAYPEDTRGVVQREAGGFGFGKLANESITKNAYAPKSTIQLIANCQARGWYKNIATTGKMKEVPWSHLIFDTRYSDYVDVFEGAFDYTRSIWRSESSSCLSTGIPYYNAISRQAITERIKEYAGEPFSIEDFYLHDTNEWGGTSTKSALSNKTSGVNHTPILVKGKYIRK